MPERRKHLRLEVHLDKLLVTVGAVGTELTKGVVLNIGRGGMKVCLEHEILDSSVGYDCLVFFAEDPQGRVSEQAKHGRLLRMQVRGQYAIEFDSPLKELNLGSDPETVEIGATSDADG